MKERERERDGATPQTRQEEEAKVIGIHTTFAVLSGSLTGRLPWLEWRHNQYGASNHKWVRPGSKREISKDSGSLTSTPPHEHHTYNIVHN